MSSLELVFILSGAIALVAARWLHKRAVRRAESNLRTVFDTAPIGNAVLGPRDRIVEANHALGRIVGFTPRELLGRTLSDIVHPEDAGRLTDAIAALRSGEQRGLETELRCLHATGQSIPAAVHAAALRSADGDGARVLLQVLDITERKRVEAHLQHMADHDPLTGLLNRRRFEQELERHVAQAQRYGTEGAVLVLDVDRFKQVNDAYGHTTGDRVINSVARVLRRRLRTTDTLARLGGDEFAVLLPKADRREAEIVARRLVEAIRAQADPANDERTGAVTISVGAAVLDERETLSAEAAMVDADLAMYDAKDAGGDGYAFFTAEVHAATRARARTTWRDRIVDALANDRFALVAQPVLDAQSGKTVQHELLLRMTGPHGTLIPPAAFLSIAERDGLIVAIDQWVVRRAIGLLAELEQRGEATRLEVNISGRSISDATLLALIAGELKRTGADPRNLVFEIPETAAVADVQLARAFAQHVQGLGCQFAIDDFGAGLASLYYLKHLPFDALKLDGELVGHCTRNPADRLLIESAVNVVHGLGRSAIAEQVGDAETHALLRELGVNLVQGHHFGMPLPLDAAFGSGGTPAPATQARLRRVA
ncbi:bifunctional diguanylate cyclase/phosphodiesterase [Conexibacter sp. CPCC 206217]|uniref:putative bifunctional diguanylate cyclase/phosphodiesterase n=1 Tax=Conexibacter sp. CPCC 206217 TaxID=3064574 RepID=UPI002728CE36|nr:EAL domain-containing protein [Conexibacter sp. CPCC 206217]MDO8212113.1 EAL domain-containing protein [Conexibacter sp. CPCC 206217]